MNVQTGERSYRIGEVAERAGVTTRTIRYYEELVALAEAQEARAALRDQWADSASDRERARIVDAAISVVERQLDLVQGRQQRLSEFADELSEKLRSLNKRQAEFERKEKK